MTFIGTSQENLKKAYLLSYDKARQELALRDDPQTVAAHSWTEFDETASAFSVKYLNENYHVHYPSGEVTFADGRADEVPTPAKIVMLHYLLTTGPETLTGKSISFKEVPGGMIYLQPFEGRVLGGFKAVFGRNAALLGKAAEKVGARQTGYGDMSVTLDILPKIPVTYILWEGDDEFSASGTVLFDSSVKDCLPTEDLVVACAAGASLINKTAKTLAK